mmetsp:Transcript_4012/g.10881  ORF Transcript_4012/g.10881 Transcript_4012/m.10881 type:complete len:230 (+) Transcript_4012:578-1267(+)
MAMGLERPNLEPIDIWPELVFLVLATHAAPSLEPIEIWPKLDVLFGSASIFCCSIASAWSRAISSFSVSFSSSCTRRTASASARIASRCAMSWRRRFNSAACSCCPAKSFTSSPRRAWLDLSASPALWPRRPVNSPRKASSLCCASWARLAAILSSVSRLSLSDLSPTWFAWALNASISARWPFMDFSILPNSAMLSCQSSFTHAKIISELLPISSLFGSILSAAANSA